MKTYYTIHFEAGYETTIQQARRFSDAEKQQYAEWFRDFGFVSVGETIRLANVKIADSPKRESDGAFCGSNGLVFIISAEEMEDYIALNSARQREQEEKEKNAYLEELRSAIKAAERQTDLPTKAEAQRRMKAWSSVQNEGGEGYVPHIYTKEEYAALKAEYESICGQEAE